MIRRKKPDEFLRRAFLLLLTEIPLQLRQFRIISAFIALHTKADCLPRQNIAIPTDIARGVRIRACESGIPTAGYGGAIAIGPIYAPAINQCVTDIG